jgi:HSP20 family protein
MFYQRPFNLFNLVDWQNQMANLMDQRGESRVAAHVYPKINAWSSPDHVMITAELPGLNPEDLEVSVQNSIITLSGTIPARAKQQGETYLRSERRSGKFQRELELPFRVASQKVTAEYKNGVLSLVLPRAEEDKAFKIPVSV